ncbi:hypothetical protein ACLB2K_038969 [Fragaria x ananassa]
MVVDILGLFHHLPDDLVINNILKRLPTKIAMQVAFVSKQWEAVMSSNPILIFYEDFDLDRCHDLSCYNDYIYRHNRFINFLQGYSEHRDNKMLIDKLRLHMRMFTFIDRWVELIATEGDVKELDINIQKIVSNEQYEEDDMLNQRPAMMENSELRRPLLVLYIMEDLY